MLMLINPLCLANVSIDIESVGKVGSEIVLVEHAKTNYQIIITKNADESVREAAKELRYLIQKSTGAKMKITTSPAEGYRYIFIGMSDYTRSAGISSESWAMDSYRIFIKEQNLYLIGRDDKKQAFYRLNSNQSASVGSYFAVIDFVRRFLNARWYMPGPLGAELSSLARLSIPSDLKIVNQPYYQIRSIDIAMSKNKKREEDLRQQGLIKGHYFNSEAATLATKWGRHLRLGSNFQLSVGHSWYKWLPAEEPSGYSTEHYGVSNPEFYATPAGSGFLNKYYHGKGNDKGGQLCICNLDVANALADNIITYAKKTGQRNFSLSPNDGGWPECTCQCCRQIPSHFERDTAELTAELIKFSNKVAGRVLKQIPDAIFGLYLYNDMSEPPSYGKAIDKINLSDVYNGLAYIYHIPKEKKKTELRISQWRERAQSIVLTTYYSFYGHYSLPWSTVKAQEWLLQQMLKSRSSSGLRINYALLDSPPMGALGPDPWVMSELLWNPHQSVTQLENEFYSGAFGELAGNFIQQYFTLISESMVRAIDKHPFTRASGVKNYIEEAYFPIRNRCRRLIDSAVKAASGRSERYQWRIDRVARAWQLAELTLDMLQAEKRQDIKELERLIALRVTFLADKENIFAIAPLSTEYEESIAPLLHK